MKNLSYKRHIFKAVTWRITGTVDTILISWLVTQNLESGFQIGVIELFTKLFLYFIHERIWYNFFLDHERNSRIRHIFKSLSWRFLGSIDTTIISWILTGNISFAFSIASIEVVSKIVLYYLHERVWYRIKYGVT